MLKESVIFKIYKEQNNQEFKWHTEKANALVNMLH